MRLVAGLTVAGLVLGGCGDQSAAFSTSSDEAETERAAQDAGRQAIEGGPDWLQPIPDAIETADTVGDITGNLRADSTATTEDILDFYADIAEDEGLTVSERSDTDLVAEAGAPMRSLSVHVDPSRAPQGQTWVRVGYTDYS